MIQPPYLSLLPISMLPLPWRSLLLLLLLSLSWPPASAAAAAAGAAAAAASAAATYAVTALPLLLQPLPLPQQRPATTESQPDLSGPSYARRRRKRRGAGHTGSDTESKNLPFVRLIEISGWTLDCSDISYGLRRLHIMNHGAGCLARCEAETGKAVKTQALNCSCLGYGLLVLTWLIDGQCRTLDCACIGYGLRLFHVIHDGAGRLARCKAETGKAEKHRPSPALASATDFDCSLGSSTDNAGPSTALASTTDFDSSLGSSTNNTGPSTALASATDFDCFTSCTMGLAALPAETGKAKTTQALKCSCIGYGLRLLAWLIDGQCWTLDCSCIGYGL
jgi:hypothetical protein